MCFIKYKTHIFSLHISAQQRTLHTEVSTFNTVAVAPAKRIKVRSSQDWSFEKYENEHVMKEWRACMLFIIGIICFFCFFSDHRKKCDIFLEGLTGPFTGFQGSTETALFWNRTLKKKTHCV